MKNGVLVVIPTFNCESQIIKVLAKISIVLDFKFIEVWIVDNQSTDSTFENALNYVKKQKMKRVKVFQTFQNNSLGGTIKIAFNSARRGGFEDVVIFHGDNQGEIEDLFNIIKISRSQQVSSSIFGSRFMRSSKLVGYSQQRIFGNIVLNCIYSFFTKRFLSDLGSGLNLYKVKDISDLNYMNLEDSLTFNYELILLMISKKKSFKYYPIIWREDDQISNAKNLTIFFSALKILFNHLVKNENLFYESSKIYRIK